MENEEGVSRKERERRHQAARLRADQERAAKSEARLRENVGKPANATSVLVWDKTTGESREVPSVDARHVRRLGFVQSLPGDAAGGGAAAVASEMQARGLHELLLSEHHVFWSHAMHDEELRRFLDSYLRYCPRAFDEGFAAFSAGGKDVRAQIFQRVLMVLVRASTARESKDYFVDQAFFEAWLQSPASWFDVPRLLDICVLYLEANRKLVQSMVQNVWQGNSSKLTDELRKTVVVLVKTMDKAFGTGAEGDRDLFLLDSLCTVHSFLIVFPKAAKHFFGLGMLPMVAKSHSVVVGQGKASRLAGRIQRLSVAICFLLLDLCLLSRVLEPGTNKVQESVAKELVTALRDLDCRSPLMGAMQALHDVAASIQRILGLGTGLPRAALEECVVKLKANDILNVSSMEEKIPKNVQQILDVLPELGVPFVQACLKHMDMNAENVLNALLTNDLPPALEGLDRKTGKAKVAVVVVAAVGNGKGKEEEDDGDDDDVVAVVEKKKASAKEVAPMTSCMMEEILEDRGPLLRAKVRQGKATLEDEPIDSELREQITRYAYETTYDDEYDDSFQVHASNHGMERVGIDEVESQVQGNAEAVPVTSDGSAVAKAASATNKKNNKNNAADKANRGRRKQQNLKKNGMMAQ